MIIKEYLIYWVAWEKLDEQDPEFEGKEEAILEKLEGIWYSLSTSDHDYIRNISHQLTIKNMTINELEEIIEKL